MVRAHTITVFKRFGSRTGCSNVWYYQSVLTTRRGLDCVQCCARSCRGFL